MSELNGSEAGHLRGRKRAVVVAFLIIVGVANSGCAGQTADGPVESPTTVRATTAPATTVPKDTVAAPPTVGDGAGQATTPASSDVPGPAKDPSTAPTAAQPVGSSLTPADTDSAPPGVAAAPMPGSRPVRLQIPALGIDTGLLDLGLQDDGTLEVPPDGASVGWFTGGPSPGALGPAVIVGHVDWAGELGLFYYLKDLTSADDITVTRADGTQARFRVTSNEEFPKDEFPTDAVYGNLDHAGLRLITCGGEFDRQAHSYTDNIIVFADLIESQAS
jgi:hypothetical protein